MSRLVPLPYVFGARIVPLEFTVILGLAACTPEEPSTGNTGGSPGSTGGGNSGGALGTGGLRSTGGTSTGGAALATGGRATGGTSTGGAATGGGTGPCDIYQSGNTPCVAAHSTVRALYGSYSGNLYQVRRASDKTTKDIPVLSPGGYANSATQDSFCSGTTCTISIIYDQSPRGNHLKVTPPGGWLANGGTEANATAARITASGHTVYGVYTTGSFDEAVGGVGYRNNTTQGVATGDQPEAMYMVASGKHYNQWCCFDYGNAETNNLDNGNGTMEAVYFGNSTQWGKGSGTGPWVMADLENGVFAGQSFDPPATNTSLVANYVTAMLKGRSGTFALKGGDAQSGTLKTMYDGPRPSGGYNPMKKEGAIILGVGGDNSHTGEGTFFEGCMTSGSPSDATDDAVQANIVAAKYGS
jgi:non-reducing end alpha-L-arabinofuranosidase